MKKYFYLAAVSAMMLTACSSEQDVVQPTPEPSTPTVAAQQQAVAFDTYLSGTTASTRAGDPEGVMTTDKLKTPNKGFGVFAMYTGSANYASATAPNFMYNEQIHWANGWTYSPLKYWPNETSFDSQDPKAVSPETDKLSFFAYAPYVSAGTGNKLDESGDDYFGTSKNAWKKATETYGITALSKETYAGDPLVEWQFSSDIDKNVDLLWGVAPAGNLTYTSVDQAQTINKTFGLPLTDLVKPDKETKVKFLFQHALSRIGLSVVSAIDQIDAGDAGEKYKQAQTRVLIEEVKIWGDFGIKGTLNLNNDVANKARWIDESIVESASSEGSPLFDFTVANGKIAKDLRYENLSTVTGAGDAAAAATAFLALNPGVTPSEKVLLASGPDNGIALTGTALNYEQGKKLYTLSGVDYVMATTNATSDVDAYTKDASGDFTQVYKGAGGTDGIVMSGETPNYYSLSEVNTIAVSAAGDLTSGKTYYTKAGAGLPTSAYVYTKYVADGTETTGTYIELSETLLNGKAYTGTCYLGLSPRYFMVVPSQQIVAPTQNTVNVMIKYHVITNDGKLSTYISDVTNTITKQAKFTFESGKSYNLKLILGLTSVKLDATVADWQVGDDAEVWLPKNN